MEKLKDYCVFDLETTGISTDFDDVIEISAVKVMDGVVVDEFTTLVNPKRLIPEGASAVNGITDEMVADAPTFDIALEHFLSFAGDMVLVGHNIKNFDMKFLYRDAKAYWGKEIPNKSIDTLQMSRALLPQLASHRLTVIAENYGINPDGAHRALADCRMNQKVFERLQNENQKICPKCGRVITRKSGRFGDFYGCTGYPECRYTESLK